MKNRIINALRKLTYSYRPRNIAKAKRKVGPATYSCEHCEGIFYTGSKTLENASLGHLKGVTKGAVFMDHIEAVIPPQGFVNGSWDWNEYIDRLFCESSGFQVLCKECHDAKTYLEKQIRAENRIKKT